MKTVQDILDQKRRIENLFLFGKADITIEEMRKETAKVYAQMGFLAGTGIIAVLMVLIKILLQGK